MAKKMSVAPAGADNFFQKNDEFCPERIFLEKRSADYSGVSGGSFCGSLIRCGNCEKIYYINISYKKGTAQGAHGYPILTDMNNAPIKYMVPYTTNYWQITANYILENRKTQTVSPII